MAIVLERKISTRGGRKRRPKDPLRHRQQESQEEPVRKIRGATPETNPFLVVGDETGIDVQAQIAAYRAIEQKKSMPTQVNVARERPGSASSRSSREGLHSLPEVGEAIVVAEELIDVAGQRAILEEFERAKAGAQAQSGLSEEFRATPPAVPARSGVSLQGLRERSIRLQHQYLLELFPESESKYSNEDLLAFAKTGYSSMEISNYLYTYPDAEVDLERMVKVLKAKNLEPMTEEQMREAFPEEK